MLADQPPRPSNMANIVAINQGRRPLTLEDPRAAQLGAAEVSAALVDAARDVVDVRDWRAFAGGHVAGALNIPVASATFEQNVGWLAPERRLVLVVADAHQAERALLKLAFVGLDDHVEGFATHAACAAARLQLRELPLIDVEALGVRLGSGGLQLLDVRESEECGAGTIDGAICTSFRLLPERLEHLDLARERPTAVICGGGLRSSIAASLLLRRGFTDVLNVEGGMGAWQRRGRSGE